MQSLNMLEKQRGLGEYEGRKSVGKERKSSESGNSSSRKRKLETSGKSSSGNTSVSGGKKEFKKKEFRKKGLCASGEDRRRSEPDLRKEF